MKKLKKKATKTKDKVKAKVVLKRKVKGKAAVKKKVTVAPKAEKTAPKKKGIVTKKSSAKEAKAEADKRKVKTAEKPRAETPKKTAGRIKVLSVDDEEVIRSLLKRMLTKAGYEVVLAESGEEGLKVMKREIFDLAVIDLKMPGMGGIAFLEKMKDLYPNTEAVILTGFGDIDIAVDAMKKGAFNFVPKPFKKDVFLTIISKALERQMMRKEMENAKNAIRDIESEASRKIGELEGQLASVEQAKVELGEQYNSIKLSLVDGTETQNELEKKVVSLERVAGKIKTMEEKVLAAEKEKREVLKKAKNMEKELASKVSGKIELGNKLDEAKAGLNTIKKEISKKEKSKGGESTEYVSLTDIHRALSDLRKGSEGQ